MPLSRGVDPKGGRPVNGALTGEGGAGVSQEPERNSCAR